MTVSEMTKDLRRYRNYFRCRPSRTGYFLSAEISDSLGVPACVVNAKPTGHDVKRRTKIDVYTAKRKASNDIHATIALRRACRGRWLL